MANHRGARHTPHATATVGGFALRPLCTECGHCHTPLHLEVDSELNYRVQESDASPLLFVPLMNLRELDDPSIIDAF